jgi:hypothetical protein
MTREELEKTYPAVELAYPIAVAAYEVALKRLDGMDGRLQTILAFIVAVSAAVPPVAANRGIHFRSPWFYAALGIFILSVVIGTWARLAGAPKVLNPRKAFNHWLHKSDWEFKKDFIAFAADDFDYNRKLVKLKWLSTVAITLLFACQAVCLAVWVMGSF